MDTMISIHNIWCKKILNKEKLLEFRNNIGKDINVGDTVYMYETYFKGGRKKVVGEFTIKSINKIERNNARLGCYPFLKIYAEQILQDQEIVKLMDRVYKINLKSSYNDLVLDSMFVQDELEYMEKHSEAMPLDFESSFLRYSNKSYRDSKDKAKKLMHDCDNWLRSIGYYNEYDESFYKYFIEIEKPIKYDNPLDISEFELLNGKQLKKAPQSWCYVKRREK